MSTMAFRITSLTTVYSTVYSGTVQRKYQSSASLVFVQGIHRWPVNSPHKGPITQPLLAHHWRVHQYLLTSRFIAPPIPWGVSARWGSSFLWTIFFLIIHRFLSLNVLLLIYFLFKKHCIQYISISKKNLHLVKGILHHYFMAGCGSLMWAITCSLWSGIYFLTTGMVSTADGQS